MEEKKSKIHLPKQWVGCEVEEAYFGDDRKLSKQERKLASAKDRSKFKKTDKDKAQKQTEQIKNLKKNKTGNLKGRVLSIVPEGVVVEHEGKRIVCGLRGILKKDKGQHKNLVTVGDVVEFVLNSPTEGAISGIEPRRSVLSRADNLSRRKEQIIAANIDQVLITVSVIEPPLKASLIDRYIIAARKGNLTPVIIINKVDLLRELTDEIEIDPGTLETEEQIFKEVLAAYTNLGLPVIAVSTVTGEGIETLKNQMKDKSSVFSGQSGVGKSSLINATTGMALEIGEIVEKTKKGTHTTTTTNLLPLEFGGWCIDTPGIKSFGVWELEKGEVEQYFSEIFEYGRGCRFPNCSHTHESGCAVHLAVDKGQISLLRFDSYLSLMESVGSIHLRR